MRIAAFDLSLTRTGWASNDGDYGSIKTDKLRGHDRLARIHYEVLRLTDDCDVVVLEGPAFGAKGRAVLDIGGMRGIVTHSLWQNRIPYVEVPPSVLKKYATGKGNDGKDAVIAAAIRSLDFQGSDNNEADAWCLLHMADAHYNHKPPQFAYRAEMLAKVDWPTIGATE